jgi:hypothetical protein
MNLASGIRLTHLDATRLNQFANQPRRCPRPMPAAR